MSASYLAFNEPQVHEPLRRSGKVQALVSLLIGFGLGCAVFYVAGGQPLQPLDPAINLAWTQPAQASRFMQPVMPMLSRQSVSVSASAHDEPTAISAQPGRRELMTGLGFAAAGAVLKDQAAQAAYGENANVFGRVTNSDGFFPYAGDGFSMLLPSKWKDSKERDFKDEIFRYEDNFDQVNYLAVLKKKGGALGSSPEDFIKANQALLGEQSFAGETTSEGGFAPNRVSAASILDLGTEKDKKGRTVYTADILTRTADGNEGGRHQLFKAVQSGGDLYVLKVQMGDKRWFRGQKSEAEGIFKSFTVA
eukprot:gnl/TRDRNA2_/TRDRNA2_175112_c0_seq2.p1 gnl/TRDRNA2_/TRDRNA2_175112_c0~~gnl/TRDRNA2_/TRDRNA2_175112_c0_seq2.p1  ORF type:complete len:307 (-),score=44.57 gnl/TRDRNA2_/TRDRNA2_175112_c0_seq2:584-1504(-)